jgi:hypothetical protein
MSSCRCPCGVRARPIVIVINQRIALRPIVVPVVEDIVATLSGIAIGNTSPVLLFPVIADPPIVPLTSGNANVSGLLTISNVAGAFGLSGPFVADAEVQLLVNGVVVETIGSAVIDSPTPQVESFTVIPLSGSFIALTGNNVAIRVVLTATSGSLQNIIFSLVPDAIFNEITLSF